MQLRRSLRAGRRRPRPRSAAPRPRAASTRRPTRSLHPGCGRQRPRRRRRRAGRRGRRGPARLRHLRRLAGQQLQPDADAEFDGRGRRRRLDATWRSSEFDRRSRSRRAGCVNLADEGGITVTGDFDAGDFADADPHLRQRRHGQDQRPGRHRLRRVRRPRPVQHSRESEPDDRLADVPPTAPREPDRAEASAGRAGEPYDCVAEEAGGVTHTLVLLRHGESDWNAKNLFTGWVDVASHRQGPRRGRARRRAAARGRARPRRRAHLAAAPRDHHRGDRARRRRPALDPGRAGPGGSTSGTTARCRARTRSRRSRSTARSSSCSGAARSTYPRRRSRRLVRVVPGRAAAVRRPRRRAAPHRVPQGRHRPVPALLGVRHRPRPAGRARPCWSPRTATACAPWSSTSTASATRTSPASTSPPACRWSTSSTTTCCPPSPGGRYLDPEAAAEAAAAVANQG